MRLICFNTTERAPRIVAASRERDWMDQTPEHFAYRCLPLNIANGHGWMILNPCAFVAQWNGGAGVDAVAVQARSPGPQPLLASSHFGSGVLTIAIQGLFRTEPGYDLWVCGPTNMIKDGIQPLTGVVETDWSPFSFTMNYKFTRAFAPVSFDLDEPYCMFFPLKRGTVETVVPEFQALDQNPDVHGRHQEWTKSREDFNSQLRTNSSSALKQKWQKHYFQGNSQWADAPSDHRTKIRLKEFR